MKRLTSDQVTWLQRIYKAGAKGLSTTQVLRLRGKAKDGSARYAKTLHNAVEAHNAGQAVNSPVPSPIKIIAVGDGWRATDKDAS